LSLGLFVLAYHKPGLLFAEEDEAGWHHGTDESIVGTTSFELMGGPDWSVIDHDSRIALSTDSGLVMATEIESNIK
jgi:hypothetical protein